MIKSCPQETECPERFRCSAGIVWGAGCVRASAAVSRRLAGARSLILACHVSYLRGRRHPKCGAPRLVRMCVVTDPDATGVLAEVLGSVYVLIRMPFRHARRRAAQRRARDTRAPTEVVEAHLRGARRQRCRPGRAPGADGTRQRRGKRRGSERRAGDRCEGRRGGDDSGGAEHRGRADAIRGPLPSGPGAL